MQFFACTVKIKRSCKKKIEDLCQQPFSVGRFTVSFMCTIKSKLFLQLHLVEYSKNKKKGGKLQISSTGSRFNGLSEVRKV